MESINAHLNRYERDAPLLSLYCRHFHQILIILVPRKPISKVIEGIDEAQLKVSVS